MTANFKREIVFPNANVRAKFIPLKVSAPFHCALMQPAENEMRTLLTAINFQLPEKPIVQNFTAKMTREPNDLREQLIRQVTAPVLWAECMRAMLKAGIVRYIECGSGRVLAGLAKKIDPEKTNVWNINSLDDLKAIEASVKV